MRVFLVGSLGVSLFAAFDFAKADTEFEDSIPIAVAEALFDIGLGGQFAAYSDIMDDFPEFQLPSEFDVMGSVVQNSQMRVALTTELEESAATEALKESFLDSGWVEMPQFQRFPSTRGFVSAVETRTFYGSQICHDEHGQLSIGFRQRDEGNVVSLRSSYGFARNWRNCDELIAQQEQSMAMMRGRSSGLGELMPRLEVPEEARQGSRPALMLGGMSSSSDSAETDARIELEWELERVYQHFAEQILEQGWTLDTESIGSLTATGTWTQTVEQNVNVIARLDVVSAGDGDFDLTMTVEVPGGRGGVGIFRSN